MKLKFSIIVFSLMLILSCNSSNSVPNTDIEVARAFINDILHNDFSDAEKFILKEDTNKQYLDQFKEYAAKSKESENYKNADIIINEITPVNDSVSVINYSITKNKSNKLKMVRVDGQWLVDLKYTFSGNL